MSDVPQPSDAPRVIYLQVGPDYDGEPFAELAEVSWCADRINKHDIKYVLASTVPTRDDGLEEAAKVADIFWSDEADATNLGKQTAVAIAAAIRARKGAR